MNEKTLDQTIAAFAVPLAASLGLAVWGVEAGFGKRSVIRIFVDGDNGVDIDACAELSRLLGLTLEVEDVIDTAYVLEVSSPGLERTFFRPEQLARYVGKTIEVALHLPTPEMPGRKRFIGTLIEAEGTAFSLLPSDVPAEQGTIRFTWDEVKKASLVHFPPQPDLALKGRKPKEPKKKPGTPAPAADHDAADGEIPA